MDPNDTRPLTDILTGPGRRVGVNYPYITTGGLVGPVMQMLMRRQQPQQSTQPDPIRDRALAEVLGLLPRGTDAPTQ